MSRTFDDSTYATDPGLITLSHKKLRVLRPDLYGIRGFWYSLMGLLNSLLSPRLRIKEGLLYGDSRAAVVISTSPLLIAAYTDELDCIAMLRFPDNFADQYNLLEASRLLTVNSYKSSQTYDQDLILGPDLIERWSGFNPLIAEFLTEDYDQVEARKNHISDEEWQRAFIMGKEYMNRYPGVARDGRPAHASFPARVPHHAFNN
ncbi:MAG TPA: hypothetical protein ENL03_06385 [Phycisphaerae bacterium]|nr:hypothetical protein [Phycisphaerae bacterium]